MISHRYLHVVKRRNPPQKKNKLGSATTLVCRIPGVVLAKMPWTDLKGHLTGTSMYICDHRNCPSHEVHTLTSLHLLFSVDLCKRPFINIRQQSALVVCQHDNVLSYVGQIFVRLMPQREECTTTKVLCHACWIFD